MNYLEEIRRTLRADGVVQSVVGFDSDREVKVYTTLGKSNITAPYVVLAMLPSLEPVGVYGDDYVWQEFEVQVSCWSTNEHDSGFIADILDDAILKSVYLFDPWSVAKVKRNSVPRPMADRDTNLVQVFTTYLWQLAR